MWWLNKRLFFMGEGYENTVPVYAVADGLLTRCPDWDGAVVIQHDDPLRPGEKVWSFYGDMADGRDDESYVVPDFPPGSVNAPVKAEQLLGYQGRWSGQPSRPMWIHLRFSVVRAAEDGSFPDEVGLENVLDPSPYLGIALKAAEGDSGWQPLRCKEE